MSRFFDEELMLSVRRRGALSRKPAVPKAHVESDEEMPLGLNPGQEEISSLDIPRDSPAYRAVRRREREHAQQRMREPSPPSRP